MKILVLNTPLFTEPIINHNDQSLPPLGLGFIVASLRKDGFMVTFIDAFLQNLSVTELLKTINDIEPDFIVMNVFSANLMVVHKIIAQVKTSINIILGGGTNQVYQDILNWNFSQEIYVILGEGELILPEIIKGKCNEYLIKRNNIFVISVNPSSKFFPHEISDLEVDHSIFLNEPFFHHQGFWEAYISVNRGCIYNCAFCGSARSLNSSVPIRTRSVVSVQKEIDGLIKLYPYLEAIRVLDDLFLQSSSSAVHAIKIFEKYSLSWRSTAHILSLSTISDNLLGEMCESGCRELFIGIESGSPRILKMIHKTPDISLIKQTVKRIMDNGISVKGYFIMGFPTESIDDLQMTLDLAEDLQVISSSSIGQFRTSVFRFRPYHGTELFDYIYSNIKKMQSNEQDLILSEKIGRAQFNVTSGNYSEIEEQILQDFIYKMSMIR
jgi:radical SAM superfamily enzyme YgiQ (UPF0313 family)